METIKLNLIPTRVAPTAHVSQNDEGRVIRLELYDGPLKYTLSGSENIRLRIRKIDGNVANEPVVNTAESYVDIVTTHDMTDTAGRLFCKLRIGGIGTKAFYIDVEKKP